ncbi:MAG: glycosyl transferase family 1, partial [Pseudomonadota bacterium]|nr:glycosyl transferase family 1 [Pseudomonadota bacterium]
MPTVSLAGMRPMAPNGHGGSRKPVVLLVAEAVTLAHFARIAVLARALALDSGAYRVVVASDPRYAHLEPELAGTFYPLHSIPSSQFEQALARGKPLYDAATLADYVKADLSMLSALEPDLVIGDFRLSLAVSAPVHGVTYAAMVNSYWSPYAQVSYPVPDLPMTSRIGVAAAQRLFNASRAVAFAMHARPLNQVRRRYGLPSLGHDLRVAYSWGNHTLYPDLPGFVPMADLPPNHHFVGPLLWSADVPLPEWWGQVSPDVPMILVTMGSSGAKDLIPVVIEALK